MERKKIKAILPVLLEVRELLSDKKRWCKGEYARNSKREGVDLRSKSATNWCLRGAILKVLPKKGSKRLESSIVDYLDSYMPEKHLETVAEYNDAKSTRHRDVLALLDRAIELRTH